MSQQTNQDGLYVSKPKAGIYSAMLIVSMIAIGIGITCMCLEMAEYNWEIHPLP